MEKLINFYKKLSPPARFRLIFFILASLIVVPVWRNTGVEVYEPYKYDIEDVKENQVVFALRRRGGSVYYMQDDVWLIRKDGTCRLKDLTFNRSGHYSPNDWVETDTFLLEELDRYMQDETLPETDEKLMLDKDTMNYCINLSQIEYKTSFSKLTKDAHLQNEYYVICGTGKNRHLKQIAVTEDEVRLCGDLNIIHTCALMAQICRKKL